MSNRAHAAAGRDSHLLAYHRIRGDDLLQDRVFSHDTLKRGLDIVANKYGGKSLAYTPEMSEIFQQVLERRYATTDGPQSDFHMPHYAPYEDKQMAEFYGVDTTQRENLRARKETHDETLERIIQETAAEVAEEIPGLQQMMNHYAREEWARHGISDENAYKHEDPDITLFRNPDKDWSAYDRSFATADRSNVINVYEGIPEYTFEQPHNAWLVDRPGGFYNNLEN